MSIRPRLLLASSDLQAVARITGAADAADIEVLRSAATGFTAMLGRAPALLVIDLDGGGQAAVDEVAAARAGGTLPARVLGFYSHVDEGLRAAADGAGIDAHPRGRFWRRLPQLLADSDT